MVVVEVMLLSIGLVRPQMWWWLLLLLRLMRMLALHAAVTVIALLSGRYKITGT